MSAGGGDMGDTFNAMKEASKERRANNRDRSTEILVLAGVPFVSKNNGAHLIVDGRFDFWPGTGLWKERDARRKGRGIRSLLASVKPEATSHNQP